MNASYQHFLSIQPGLEEILWQEIDFRFNSEIFEIELLKKEKGGILLKCPLATTEYLLSSLKTPTKILLQIESFKVSDFPKLYTKSKNLIWSNWLRYPSYYLNCSSQKSRLIHTQRIQETIDKGIQEYYRKNPPSEKQKSLLPKDFKYPILIRIIEDQCTVSIDISKRENGDDFFKKGLKKKNAKASLRENIAFCLYFSNYKKHQEYTNFIDPMAGAGTLALVTNDAKDDSQFVFHFLKLSYAKMKKQEIKSLNLPSTYHLNDIDNTHYDFLQQNLEGLPNTEIYNKDFEELIIKSASKLFCNLPYGKRIKINIGHFLERFFSWEKKQEELKYSCILAPREWLPHFDKNGFKQICTFENGGIKVSIFEKSNNCHL